MINKRTALFLLSQYGDAFIDFTNRKRESILATIDFNNKYIRSIKRTQRFPLKGNILIFDWTNNQFDAIPLKDIRVISPLSTLLGNKRDG